MERDGVGKYRPDRTIVATPDTLGGKYRLDGTRISVAQLKRMIAADESGEMSIAEGWPELNLTFGEIAEIQAFTFPPLYDSVIFDGGEMRCVCGEWVGVNEESVTCECGRTWVIRAEQQEG